MARPSVHGRLQAAIPSRLALAGEIGIVVEPLHGTIVCVSVLALLGLTR